MKAKRWISLLLAVSMMLGVLAMPASAAAQQPESTAVVSEELPDAAELSAAEDENDIVSIRIRATGNLVYGSDYKLEVETRPENTQYIAVVLGTSGEAYGYVTLMISDKLRTLLKLIPLPKKMSQTPDQAEEFNVYSYLKQLIDGNDVSVLLRVADDPRLDIVGHFDLITKFDEPHTRYPIVPPSARAAMERLIRAGKIFEINTGAISRGYRQTPYPAEPLLRLLREMDGKILFTADAHRACDVAFGYAEAVALARRCGFDTFWRLTEEGFVPAPLHRALT